MRIIAGILGCSFDDLRQREKLRLRKQRRIGNLIALVSLTLSSSIGVYIWDYNQVKKSFSIERDTSRQIHRFSITKDYEIKCREQVYHLFHTKRKLIRYVCKTSYEFITNCKDNDFSEVRYEYNGDQLARIKQYDDIGRLIRNLRISENGTLGISDKGTSASLSECDSNITLWSDPITSKTNIARFKYEHNPVTNQITKVRFLNGYGYPTRDVNNVYGKEYEYDKEGRAIFIKNLGFSGNPAPDSKGFLYEKREYLENIITTSYYGINDKSIEGLHGFHTVKKELDSLKRTISQTQYDSNGNRKGSECNPHISKIQ